MRSAIRSLAWVVAIVPGVVSAQDNCFPPTDSHEAQTFGILSAPLAFGAAGGGGGGVAIGLEAASLPTVPEEIATPTTCRPGKGPENTNPLPGFLRVRLDIAAGDWRFDLGWIPPVRLEGVRSNLVGIGVGRQVAVGRRWTVMPRGHLLVGRVRGPFTCDDEALQEAGSECLGGTRSNDKWDPNLAGLEVTVARKGSPLTPHAGVGWTWLRPRFQVEFTNSFGETDRRRVEVDLTRVAVFAGLSIRTGGLRWTGEGYFTMGDRVAGRMVARLPL